jgi:hypothetical protein
MRGIRCEFHDGSHFASHFYEKGVPVYADILDKIKQKVNEISMHEGKEKYDEPL